MKKYSMILCLMLALICALPTFAGAETQQEFELRCYRKTAAATDVYDFRYKAEGEIIDHIPAGTYVIIHSSGEWYYITYMKNGVKKSGSVKVGFVDTASVVRRSDGMADLVHEKDPDYSVKIKQGVLEFDVTQYDDKMEYAAYIAGLAPEPERKSDAARSNSSTETNGTKSQNNSCKGPFPLGTKLHRSWQADGRVLSRA